MQSIVETRSGRIQGLTSEDGKTLIFRGIPYAKAPVGKLRFKRPEACDPWEDVLDCTQFRASTMQPDTSGMDFYGKEFYDVPMPPVSEDGLHLNIWTPAGATAESALPVLFWIHGGAFLNGFGAEKEFDGETFARQGVILVTINYRLNVFGFFTHPDLEAENEEHVSGNYGILDQLFALDWVRDNIRAFGGDPDRITIFGQSAGCMSVQTIISSPLSRGKVHGAILQSAGGIGGLAHGAEKEQLVKASTRVMEILGVNSVAELREVPAQRLLEASLKVVSESQGLPWSPYVDGYVLPTDTDTAALSGAIPDIPYMIGSCGNDIAPEVLGAACRRFCENQIDLGRTPAYLYLFDRKLPGDDAGAFHSSELWYVFHTLDRCWRPMTAHDYTLADQISTYWANFARFGNPNGEGLPRWDAWSKENPEPLMLA